MNLIYILLHTKTDEMHANLLAQFFLRRTRKKYLTLVSPSPDPSIADEGTIDSPVGGRPAKSNYRIVERYGKNGALVEFEIYTGRKHQVRVHAVDGLSTPVLMDDLYGVPTETKDDAKQRFFLHSSSLEIPEYGIDESAPLPAWWDETIAAFRQEA